MSESVLPPVPRNERFDVLAPRVPLADLGSVHVLAAGGAGMSAIVRLLVDAGGDDHPVKWLLAPLSAGASVVVCANASPEALREHAEREGTTHRLG